MSPFLIMHLISRPNNILDFLGHAIKELAQGIT